MWLSRLLAINPLPQLCLKKLMVGFCFGGFRAGIDGLDTNQAKTVVMA
jgi:hypothetical protein